MNKVKISFCLFLFLLSFIYSIDLFKNINVLDVILKKDRNILTINTLTNTSFKNPSSLLDFKTDIKTENSTKEKNSIETKTTEENKPNQAPIIYFYNTHQTEEYKESIHGITPTVMTVSSIMYDELKELGISSLVEERSITKEVKKRGYDYTGTYTVSFEYLQERKKENPTLEYFFDMHRDSITGSYARKTISGKSYAKLMFLVGTKNKNYQANVKHIKIMEKYLEKNYPGLLRETYYQSHSGYNQHYSDKMFLVELGGPDNTLEEIYNTSKALAKAIKHYLEESK